MNGCTRYTNASSSRGCADADEAGPGEPRVPAVVPVAGDHDGELAAGLAGRRRTPARRGGAGPAVVAGHPQPRGNRPAAVAPSTGFRNDATSAFREAISFAAAPSSHGRLLCAGSSLQRWRQRCQGRMPRVRRPPVIAEGCRPHLIAGSRPRSLPHWSG